VIACVGGGSNAIGIFSDFINDESVRLIGVEAAGKGLHTKKHGATIQAGKVGVLHGAHTYILQDEYGQVSETHSISAGLDYPGVGPEHVHLHEIGRADYVGINDEEALAAFTMLSGKEAIIPALESAHAIAYAMKMADSAKEPMTLLVNLSGRGDKDIEHVSHLLGNAIDLGKKGSA
jgi:tryptophan synthase beta chain